jgi:hypothetical protein
MPLVLFRKIVPLCASGDGWLVPPSFIGHTHASCRSWALSRVICVSGLKFERSDRVESRASRQAAVLLHLVGHASEALHVACDGRRLSPAALRRHVQAGAAAPPWPPARAARRRLYDRRQPRSG